MSVPVIPDYISPIVGYRIWRWDAWEGLKSLNGEVWLPGRAVTAKCRRIPENHECPSDCCSCGVYAAKNYEHLEKIGLSRMASLDFVLHGEVWLWGRVVEHQLGYRAQFAYPKTFVLPPNIAPSCLESLTGYGVDILTSSNTLLWERKEVYTGAGLAWLAAAKRTPRIGDHVTMLGLGIGRVESKVQYFGQVCNIRLRNNDLYVVPLEEIVFNDRESRWEADLSKYKKAIIVPSPEGWEVLCRPHFAALPALPTHYDLTQPLPRDELRKLQRRRKLKWELEDHTGIRWRFTPGYSWLIAYGYVILVLWYLIMSGESIAKLR